MSVVDAPYWGFRHADFIVYQASGQWKIKFVTRFEKSNDGSIETWGLRYDMKHGDGDKAFELDWLTESFTNSLNKDKWRFATAFEVEAFWNVSEGGSYNLYAGFYDYLHGRREEWKKVHFDKGLPIPDTDDWISPSQSDYSSLMKWVKFPEKTPEFPIPEKAPHPSDKSPMPVFTRAFEITGDYQESMTNAIEMLMKNFTDNIRFLQAHGRTKDADVLSKAMERMDSAFTHVEDGVELAQVKSIQPNTLFYYEKHQSLYEYLFYQWEDNEIMLYGNCLDLETNDWLKSSENDLQGMTIDHLRKLTPANHEQQEFYYKAMEWAVEFDRLIYDVKLNDQLVDPSTGEDEICSDVKLAVEALKEGILEMQIPCDFNEKQAGEFGYEYEYDFVRNTLENRDKVVFDQINWETGEAVIYPE